MEILRSKMRLRSNSPRICCKTTVISVPCNECSVITTLKQPCMCSCAWPLLRRHQTTWPTLVISGFISFWRSSSVESRYLNYFDEIKNESEAEQLEILSKARYEAFVVQRLNIKAVVYLLLILLINVLLVSAIQIYLDLGLLLGGLINAVILLSSIFVYKHLCGKLLYKGLKIVLRPQ